MSIQEDASLTLRHMTIIFLIWFPERWAQSVNVFSSMCSENFHHAAISNPAWVAGRQKVSAHLQVMASGNGQQGGHRPAVPSAPS